MESSRAALRAAWAEACRRGPRRSGPQRADHAQGGQDCRRDAAPRGHHWRRRWRRRRRRGQRPHLSDAQEASTSAHSAAARAPSSRRAASPAAPLLRVEAARGGTPLPRRRARAARYGAPAGTTTEGCWRVPQRVGSRGHLRRLGRRVGLLVGDVAMLPRVGPTWGLTLRPHLREPRTWVRPHPPGREGPRSAAPCTTNTTFTHVSKLCYLNSSVG